jgi:hypothetical protein
VERKWLFKENGVGSQGTRDAARLHNQLELASEYPQGPMVATPYNFVPELHRCTEPHAVSTYIVPRHRDHEGDLPWHFAVCEPMGGGRHASSVGAKARRPHIVILGATRRGTDYHIRVF